MPRDIGSTPLFVDTSAFYARFQPNDAHHQEAEAVFAAIRGGTLSYRPLYTSRFVLAELSRLLLYYGGHPAAARALSAIRDSGSFAVVNPDAGTFDDACEEFDRYDDQEITLTDHLSATIARDRDVEHVFTYDETDFHTLEFTVVPEDVDVPI